MSYRSWLKDVKHMQDLGSHVYSTNQDWQTQDKRDQMYYALREHPVEGLGDFSQYFYGALHDALIVSFERKDREFSVTLEDFLAQNFVEILAGYVGVVAPEIKSTVTLRFHDVAYQTTAAARPDGVVRFFRYEKPTEQDYLYRDWFYRQDGRLQWIAELIIWSQKGGILTVGPFILVDCASVSVIDKRESVVRASVSPLMADLWKEYWTACSIQKRAWEPMDGPRAFERLLLERGLTASQLFPS